MKISESIVKRKNILIIVFAIALAVLIIPMVSAGAYTYLCEDDFSFEGGARDLAEDYGNIYVGSLHRMFEYYNTNEGSFLFDFLMSALHIYTRGGLPGFHFFMVLSQALFFLTLGFLIKQIVKDWAASLGVSLSAALMLLSMNNTSQGVEIYLWYTGILYILLVFILSFITANLSLYNIRTGKVRYAVTGMFIGFLASGGSLNVTASNCGWLLAILILSYPKVKENKTFALPFAGAFVGALINAVAPGNFNRLEDASTLNIFEGLANTFLCYISDVQRLASSRIFWLALFLCFSLAILLKIKILPNGVSNIQLVISFVGSFLVQFFTLFPVTLATKVSNMASMTMRTYASCEVVTKLMFIFFALILAQWIYERKDKLADALAVAILGVTVLFLLITYPATKGELKSGIAYGVIDDFKSGAMLENYNVRQYVLSTLENAEPDSDVIIYVPPFHKAGSMYGMGLDIDSEWFVNKSAAGLYNVKSVTLIYTE